MKNEAAMALGSLGGRARAKNLSSQRRREIAAMGGNARNWPERTEEQKEHRRMQQKVWQEAKIALHSGKLVRQNCFCGKPGVMHHDDYSKPLEVKWFCPSHHRLHHIALRKQNNNANNNT